MFNTIKKFWPTKKKETPPHGTSTVEEMRRRDEAAARKPASQLSQNDLYRIIQSTRMPVDYDMDVSYPKPQQYIQIKHPRDMVKAQAYIMSKVSQQSGFQEDMFIPYFMVPVENFAAWVQLLPASEDWHHSTLGGLFAHSLDVGLRALKIFENRNLYVEGTGLSLEGSLPRFRLACFLGGLLHDVGKIFEDISVTNRKGEMWVPQIEPLYTWALRTQSTEYQIIWRKGRYLESHELYTPYYIRSIIPTNVLQFLSEGDPNVARILVGALSSNATDVYGRLWNIIKTADTTSSQYDLVTHKNERTAELAKEFAFPTGIKFIEAVNQLLDERVWSINKPKGQIYVFESGAFVLWNKLSFAALSSKLKALGFPAYTHSMEVARLIVESTVAAPNEVPLGETQAQGFQMVPLWKIHVEGDGDFLALRIPQAPRLLGERSVPNATNCRLVDMTVDDITVFGTLLDFDESQKEDPQMTQTNPGDAAAQPAAAQPSSEKTTSNPETQAAEGNDSSSSSDSSESSETSDTSGEGKGNAHPAPEAADREEKEESGSTQSTATNPADAAATAPSGNTGSNVQEKEKQGEADASQATRPVSNRIRRIEPESEHEKEPAEKAGEQTAETAAAPVGQTAAAPAADPDTAFQNPTSDAAMNTEAFVETYEDAGFLDDHPRAVQVSAHASAEDEGTDEFGGEIVDADDEEPEAAPPVESEPPAQAKPIPTIEELVADDKHPRALQVTDALMVSMSQVLKRHETFTQNFCQLIFETAVSDCARKLRADSIRADQRIPPAWADKLKDIDLSDEAEAVTVYVIPPASYCRDTTDTAITLATLCRITGVRTELVYRTIDVMCTKKQADLVNLKSLEEGRFTVFTQMMVSSKPLVQNAANELKTGGDPAFGVVFRNQMKFVLQAIETDFDNAQYRKATAFELSDNTVEALEKLVRIVSGKPEKAEVEPNRSPQESPHHPTEAPKPENDEGEVIQLHVNAGASMKMIFESLAAQIEAGQGPWVKTLLVTKDVCTLEDSCLELIVEQYNDFTADKLRARIQAEENGYMGFKIRGTKIFFNKTCN